MNKKVENLIEIAEESNVFSWLYDSRSKTPKLEKFQVLYKMIQGSLEEILDNKDDKDVKSPTCIVSPRVFNILKSLPDFKQRESRRLVNDLNDIFLVGSIDDIECYTIRDFSKKDDDFVLIYSKNHFKDNNEDSYRYIKVDMEIGK